MTSLLEGAKRLVTRGSDVGARIEALERAVEAARGRLDDGVLDEVQGVVDRATGRLRLSADHTVVAIAGATGSGKSSTFNALTGIELSAVGVRRPTTSWATACVWGDQDAEEVLDWLGIPPRHQTRRDSMLDSGRGDRAMDGVVLLDLPDHDSTEVAHHLEVDRLVRLADLMVWVLDPQKYADAAIHDRYLAPLQQHADVMVVVLNHIDTVPEDRREQMVGDVRRLLEQDGLGSVPVIPISARHDIGLAELRTQIQQHVRDKAAARKRMEGDLTAAASRLQEVSGTGRSRSLSEKQVRGLEDALAESAGVPTVVAAVERSTRRKAVAATGWPLVSWVGRLKPDPLKRLHLDLGKDGKLLTGTSLTSVPEATQVQRARVDTEVRALADEAGEGLATPWRDAVRRASVARTGDLADALDGVLGRTDLGVERLPAWAGAVRVLQWGLVLAALVGGLWSALLIASGGLSQAPKLQGVALPLVLLVGGVLLGVLLGLGCRVLVTGTARSRAAAADRRLRSGVSEVCHELVVEPVERELSAYAAVRSGLATLLG